MSISHPINPSVIRLARPRKRWFRSDPEFQDAASSTHPHKFSMSSFRILSIAAGAIVAASSALPAQVTTAATASQTAAQSSTTPARAPIPCTNAPERHRFDFWIGEWDVTTSAKQDGSKGGSSVIQSVRGGCALLENWSSIKGGQGKSLNAFNPLVHEWQQYWIGQDGNVTEFRTSHFDGTSLSFLTDNGPGPNLIGRLTFTPIDSDLVRQHYESSADSGKTWTTVYDLYYHRKRP